MASIPGGNGQRRHDRTRHLRLLAAFAAVLLAAPAAATASPFPPPPGLLAFEANLGQAGADVEFLARGRGYGIRLTGRGARLALRPPGDAAAGSAPWSAWTRPGKALEISMTFEGAGPGRLVGIDRLPGHASYIRGRPAGAWRLDVPRYARVLRPGLYPGIDVVYYGREDRLEYDLVVAPGADPGVVTVTFDAAPGGAVAAAIAPGGDLVLRTPAGEVRLERPVAYQEIAGVRSPVEARWTARQSRPDGGARLAFEVGPYDRGRPLVIDPVLHHAGYLGGAGLDAALAIAVDADGHLYVAGYVESTAPGAPPGNTDVFVTKLARDGSGPLYTVYLGDEGDDVAHAIAVDGAGRAIVTGGTESAAFPTTPGALQTTAPGHGDAFLVQLSASGQELLYASYLGGAQGRDVGLAVAVDAAGLAYVTGLTESGDFPGAEGPPPGGGDAFVARIDPGAAGAAALRYARYLGGTGRDEAHAIAVDAEGAAYVAGLTASPDFPVHGAYQALRAGSEGTDAFVARLEASGAGPTWATYLGGGGDDAAFAVALDATPTVYVAGTTASTNFPVRFAFQPGRGGPAGTDAFVARLNPAIAGAKGLLYSTYLGGAGDDAGHALGLSADGHVWVAGSTTSADFPRRAAIQAPGAGRDAFAARINPAVEGDASLLVATPIGGSGDDEAHGLAVDAAGQVTVAGLTGSGDFPHAGEGLASALAGAQDAFVARLSLPDLAVIGFTAPASAGAGDVISVTETTRNAGEAPAGETATRFFLSPDNRLGADDVLLGQRPVPALAGGAEDTATSALAIPAGLAPGLYFLFARVDGPAEEALTGNNRVRRTISLGPDLAVSSIKAAVHGTTVTVTETIRNQGGGTAAPSTARYHLSPDASLDPGDAVLGSRIVGSLGAGVSSTTATALSLPAGVAAGLVHVIVVVDADGELAEVSESNNVAAAPLALGVDLVASGLSVPSTAASGSTVTVADTVVNRGAIAAPPSTTRLFLSTDAAVDAGDVVLGARAVPGLAPGASDQGSTVVTLPASLSAGQYFLLAQADADGAIAETSEANNVRAKTMAIGPDLVVESVTVPATARPGASITVKNTVKNMGFDPSPASTVALFLSRDAALDPADRLLGARAVAALAARKGHAASTSVAIPPDVEPGLYRILAQADPDGVVAETDEANNVLASSALTIGADLTLSDLTVSPAAGAIRVAATARNAGSLASPPTAVRFHLSADETLGADDAVLGDLPLAGLGAGGATPVSGQFAPPAGVSLGIFRVIAVVDPAGMAAEADEANNTAVSAAFRLGGDLVVGSLDSKSAVGAGDKLVISDVTQNAGFHGLGPSLTRFFLSPDGATAGSIPLGSREVPALAPGESSAGSASYAVPADLVPGRYVLLAVADADDRHVEADEANNVASRALRVGVDLVIAAMSAPAVAEPGGSLKVSDTTKNGGSGTTGASVTAFYLSRDEVLGPDDAHLGSRSVPSLGSGGTSQAATALTIPAAIGLGRYHVLAVADAEGAVREADEANNVAARAVVVGADLVVTALTAPRTGGAGTDLTVTDTTKNTAGGITPPATVRFYLSTDPVLDGLDVPIGQRALPALAPGAASTATSPVTIPATVPVGTYFVIALADDGNAVPEVDETNNARVSASLALGPDLVVSALTAPTSAAGTVTLSDTVTNQGGGQAPGSTVRYLLSLDKQVEGAVLIGARPVPALAPGARSSASVTFPLAPELAGIFTVIAVVNPDGAVAEVDHANNTRLEPSLKVGADLIISAFNPPAGGGAGGSFGVPVTVLNQGVGAARPTVLRLYLAGGDIAGSLEIGAAAIAELAPGAKSATTAAVAIPGGIAAGRYELLAVADADGILPEILETNNAKSKGLAIGPDLVVSKLDAPAGAGAGLAISVTDTTRNTGAGTAPASTTWFYLSPDTGPHGLQIGGRAVPELASNATSTATTALVIPPDVAPGTYWLVARADGPNAVPEVEDRANTLARAFSVGPDLEVTSLTVSASGVPGRAISVTERTKNRGFGPAGASATGFFLATSPDGVGATPLGARAVPPLAPGVTSSSTVSAIVPADTPNGRYWVTARADVDGAVAELVEDEPPLAAPLAILPNFSVSTLSAPATARVGTTINVLEATTNSGAPAGPSVTRFVLGKATSPGALDIPLDRRLVPALGTSETSEVVNAIAIPATVPTGNYYLIAVANSEGLDEVTPGDNSRSRQIRIDP